MPAREILFKIPEKCHISTPNLLPCHIHHDGMVDPVEGLWKPHATSDGPKVTYLRGRKLIGKELPLPDQYTGVLVRSEPAATSSNDTISTPNREKSATGVEFPSDEAVVFHLGSKFNKICIWTHGASASDTADPYAKCIEEWLHTASQIHAH